MKQQASQSQSQSQTRTPTNSRFERTHSQLYCIHFMSTTSIFKRKWFGQSFSFGSTRVKWFSIHTFNTIRRWCMCMHMSEFLFRFFRAHTLTTEFNDFLIQITHIYPFTVSDFGSNPRWFWTRCDVMVIMMSDLIYLACVWISNNTTKTSFEQRECAHNIYI